MDEPEIVEDQAAPRPEGESRPGLAATLALVAVVLLAVQAVSGRSHQTPADDRRERSGQLIMAGLEHHKAKRLEAAEALYREALVADPDSSLARYDLGCVALDRGRIDEAETWFRDALAADPGNQAAEANLKWLAAHKAAPPVAGPAAPRVVPPPQVSRCCRLCSPARRCGVRPCCS